MRGGRRGSRTSRWQNQLPVRVCSTPVQVGGQQLGGDPVEPPLDSALLAALEERGGLQLDWQGTTFLVGSRQGRWDGALLWQQGTATLTVTRYRSNSCLQTDV